MTVIKISTNKLLKTVSHSIAFASLVLLLGCPGNSNKPAELNSSTPVTNAPAKSDFDADRAFEYVRKQVEFGPRPPGTPELEKTRAYIIDQLRSFGLNVTTDEFHATTPVGDRKHMVCHLVDNQQSHAGLPQAHKLSKQFRRNRGRQTQRRFIQQ